VAVGVACGVGEGVAAVEGEPVGTGVGAGVGAIATVPSGLGVDEHAASTVVAKRPLIRIAVKIFMPQSPLQEPRAQREACGRIVP